MSKELEQARIEGERLYKLRIEIQEKAIQEVYKYRAIFHKPYNLKK